LHEPIRPEDHPPADQAALQSLLLMAQRSMGKDPTLPDEVAGTELMDRMGRLPNRLNAFRYSRVTCRFDVITPAPKIALHIQTRY
jgi:hypothetical protein